MVTSIGIDIVDVGRIERILSRHQDRFIGRILGAGERLLLNDRRDRAQFLAGRFAAKEALIKALGKYLTVRPSYQQIEILGDRTSGPIASFDPEVDTALGKVTTLISISHEKSYAVAMAVLSEDV